MKTTATEIKERVSILAPVIDAVQVGDNRYVAGHMSPLAAASIVLDCGLDVVVHISCRDRNRIALQADILGAAALGVTSLVLVRGEKFSDNAPIRAKGVFEVGATGLIGLANLLGNEAGLAAEPGFYIGSFVTVFDPGDDWKAARIQEKIDVGARFLQTQPCLNAELLQKYMQKLVERKILHRSSVVVEVPLLTSMEEARLLREQDKGAPIPEAAVKRIATADDPVAEGISVCAEMLMDLRSIPGVSGVNIQYGGDPENVVAAITQAGMG